MPARTPRRSEALSQEQIVGCTIEILDDEGESALTFRTLSARLSTGAGAIYHHVANKSELLVAATGSVIADALAGVVGGAEPQEAIRTISLGVFDAIDAHPWVGTHLSREPWQPAVLQIFEALGGQVQALGVPESAQFNAASALLNYILGRAGQTAAAARLVPPDTDRATFLAGVAQQWGQLDSATYPFIRQVAEGLPDHDDRDQFIAGITLILKGLTTA